MSADLPEVSAFADGMDEHDQLRAAAMHINRLEAKVRNQARQLHIKDEALHKKNLLLDAMHMVWCDGACYQGVHRYEDRLVTEELVALAERNTARLRKWFNGVRWRQTSGNFPTTSEYHRLYLERITSKVPLYSDEVAP